MKNNLIENEINNINHIHVKMFIYYLMKNIYYLLQNSSPEKLY